MRTGRIGRIGQNRLVLAALAGTLVWFADQPTLAGYNPLLEMFWDPGIWRTPAHDRVVLVLSWLVTTLFCHFILFAFQRVRQRNSTS
jgi:hypothetical protein